MNKRQKKKKYKQIVTTKGYAYYFNHFGKNKTQSNEKDKLKYYTRLFEQTFEWGCNDRAKFLYANAIYSVISKNKIYEECEQEFLDYMRESGIH